MQTRLSFVNWIPLHWRPVCLRWKFYLLDDVCFPEFSFSNAYLVQTTQTGIASIKKKRRSLSGKVESSTLSKELKMDTSCSRLVLASLWTLTVSLKYNCASSHQISEWAYNRFDTSTHEEWKDPNYWKGNSTHAPPFTLFVFCPFDVSLGGVGREGAMNFPDFYPSVS